MSDQSFGYSGKNTESSGSKWYAWNHKKKKQLSEYCTLIAFCSSVFIFVLCVGNMLKIAPAEIITFTKVGSELIGTVDIFNVVKYPITYKVIRPFIDKKYFALHIRFLTD